MSRLRGDIAGAADRMRVTFGARSAMKHLGQALQDGEKVREMMTCIFGGSEGLFVLTDRRALAVRDDYSRYLVRDCVLADLTCMDYAPTVHDGLALFSTQGKLAVRMLNPQDCERLVGSLRELLPALPVQVLAGGAVAKQPCRTPGEGVKPAAETAPKGVAAPAASLPPSTEPTQPSAPAAFGAAFSPAPSAPLIGAGTVQMLTPQPAASPVAMSVTPPGPVQADRDVLLGVLADLHARGLLTAEELAVKVTLLASS